MHDRRPKPQGVVRSGNDSNDRRSEPALPLTQRRAVDHARQTGKHERHERMGVAVPDEGTARDPQQGRERDVVEAVAPAVDCVAEHWREHDLGRVSVWRSRRSHGGTRARPG